MYGMWAEKSNKGYKESVKELKEALDTCDAVLIGAGAGLSTAAGYKYSGGIFDRYFGDFRDKYGIRDIYSGGFYPFPSSEEYWAWWSRHIYLNRYTPIPSGLYDKLLLIVKDKDYFVLTTNVDHCFQRSGFDKKRLFYTQGDYGLFQSRNPHGASKGKTYDNEDMIRKMLISQGFEFGNDGALIIPDGKKIKMEIETRFIPCCPDDGAEMVPNLRSDNTFAEDEGWHRAAESYSEFLHKNDGRRLLFLELGVGGNTPGIIKYPFWQMTAQNENAIYACINMGEAAAPNDIMEQSILIDSDIALCIGDICEQAIKRGAERGNR